MLTTPRSRQQRHNLGWCPHLANCRGLLTASLLPPFTLSIDSTQQPVIPFKGMSDLMAPLHKPRPHPKESPSASPGLALTGLHACTCKHTAPTPATLVPLLLWQKNVKQAPPSGPWYWLCPPPEPLLQRPHAYLLLSLCLLSCPCSSNDTAPPPTPLQSSPCFLSIARIPV